MFTNTFISFLPYSVMFSTIVLLLISVIIKRNHALCLLTSTLGLVISLIISFFTKNNSIPINIFNLFKITSTATLLNQIILFTAIIIYIYSYFWLKHTCLKKEEFYILLLLSTLGCVTLNISSNMISLFLTIELISLPFCGLLACNSNKKDFIESSWKYVVFSAISSSLLLLGIVLIYSISGNFNFKEIQEIITFNSKEENIVILTGFIIIFISFFLKLSIFPFYFLTPDLYQSIPVPSLMYYSTSCKTTFLFALIKLYLLLKNANIHYFILMLKTLSFFSIIIGSLLATFQKNVKRLLGYASISHFGYLLIPFILMKNQTYDFSLKSILLYVLVYTLNNIIIFGTFCIIEKKIKKNSLHQKPFHYGLFWKNPSLTIAFVIALFSSAGIPFTIGFINKLFIFLIAINNQFWLLIIGSIFGTVSSLYFYIKIIKTLFIKETNKHHVCFDSNNHKTNCFNSIFQYIICFFSLIIIFLGIFPQILMKFL